jgi:hypothetical protein
VLPLVRALPTGEGNEAGYAHGWRVGQARTGGATVPALRVVRFFHSGEADQAVPVNFRRAATTSAPW